MTQIKEGILGGTTGKVGTVVGLLWRDKFILRSLPTQNGKPASEKQLLQRAKLTLVSRFLKTLKPFINSHIPPIQGKKSMLTGTDQASSILLKQGLEVIDNTPCILLNKVTVALGTLPVAHFKEIKLTEDKQVYLQWEDNSYNSLTSENDLLSIVFFYNQNNAFHIVENIGHREDEQGIASLPKDWITGTVHLWTVWTNQDKTLNSTSIYHRAIYLD